MNFEEVKSSLDLDEEYQILDISTEFWREYEHGKSVYRIDLPVALIMRNGGSTHRIVDSNGITHCHPLPGNGCALRWKSNPSVKF